ncbi:MAG TPA: ABC transporter permease [Candidatus Paceibacterota bacterium]|nr:ABC transporter permease [Verrucomicrobiota bacterium]HRZ45682.1 ABC transporter permease [Candidatus Paceibacterota bacterium]HRZ94810.1 ABC transporter permease [Candidatus Paceibacterota bacterium]
MQMPMRQRFHDALEALGELAMLLAEAVRALARGRLSVQDLAYQFYFLGARSQAVVLITGAFTGLVLCAQTFFQFHKVKMDTATLAVVSVSMSSELGPVLTALMVAGRVGAAMAAELGTMRVTEQIDALRTLGAHPVDYLLLPRLAATVLAMPLLTAESVGIGIGAAYALGVGLLGIDGAYAWANMIRYTGLNELVMGQIKGVVFGLIIALISCYKGLQCPLGAEGVGRATTEAVVWSSIAVLIGNFFLTLLLTRLLEGLS